jgi:hypothetical protein
VTDEAQLVQVMQAGLAQRAVGGEFTLQYGIASPGLGGPGLLRASVLFLY